MLTLAVTPLPFPLLLQKQTAWSLYLLQLGCCGTQLRWLQGIHGCKQLWGSSGTAIHKAACNHLRPEAILAGYHASTAMLNATTVSVHQTQCSVAFKLMLHTDALCFD